MKCKHKQKQTKMESGRPRAHTRLDEREAYTAHRHQRKHIVVKRGMPRVGDRLRPTARQMRTCLLFCAQGTWQVWRCKRRAG